MKNLPLNILTEKNKLFSTGVWLVLLEITVSETETLRLCNNNEDVVFQGNTYVSFPFQIGAPEQNAGGQMPTVPLQVSNVSRAIQAYVEQYSGGVGFPVKIVIVNSEHLSEDYDELSYNFSIMESSYDSMWVTFHLGTPSPLRMRFPQDMFIADHCNWRYGTAAAGFVECAISAATLAQYPSCQRTLAACRLRQNSARYGGFKGLSAMGYRIAR